MSDKKKYYYLKLKDNFFESDTMILLESMKDGYRYSNILLKLYLKSLKDSGRLTLNGDTPYDIQMIAKVTGHKIGTVEKALEIFVKYGLAEILDNGVIYMSDIQNFIGESSSEADRKREYRARIEKEKLSGQNNGQMSGQKTGQNSLEIEKEIDIEKNKRIKENNKVRENYFPEDELLNEAFEGYVKMRKQIKKPMTDRAITLAISKLKELATLPFSDSMDNDLAIRILNQSVLNSWQGLFPIKDDSQMKKKNEEIDWSRV